MKYYVHYDFDLEPKEVDDPAIAISYTETRLKKETFDTETHMQVFWRRDDLGWENKFIKYTYDELIEYLNKTGEITLQLAEEKDFGWVHSTIVHIFTENKEKESIDEANAALQPFKSKKRQKVSA